MAIALAAVLASAGPAAAQVSEGRGDLRVMTYNVYQGTDFTPLLAARNFNELLIAVGRTISQVERTDPPARMQAVADQIRAAAPTLVSLQELDQWFIGPYDPVRRTCGKMTLRFDMLQELLDALAANGASYEVAVQARPFTSPPMPAILPNGALVCGQVNNNIAILARTDLDPRNFHWNNAQSGEYAAKLRIKTPIGTLVIPMAWASVDASFRGNPFRYIDTHLDTVSRLRRLQGEELREGPANVSLPVVVAMDSNSIAAPPPEGQTYQDFINAGWADAWTKTRRNAFGFTCCEDDNLENPLPELTERIDLVLTLGTIVAQHGALFGNTQASKTPDGLWPSDHAGLGMQLLVQE